MQLVRQDIETWISQSGTREQLWIKVLSSHSVSSMAELGVFRGQFAETILRNCESIESYLMIDPWRHLEDWNKPANREDDVFETYYQETLKRTDFASKKRKILRGTTIEVADEIPDESLDFAYIDGDHTLKSITIDLLKLYPKIKMGGCIGGDDYSPSIWQHQTKFEPTLVFPYAIYFAEAVGAKIYSLPYAQFIIEKSQDKKFEHVDLTGVYSQADLKSQLTTGRIIQSKVKDVTRSIRSYLSN